MKTLSSQTQKISNQDGRKISYAGIHLFFFSADERQSVLPVAIYYRCCLTLLFYSAWQIALAQDRAIQGRVSDNLLPLPGVNVMCKGTSIGTVTDAKGQFFLHIPEESKSLVFSFVGYKTQEIEVGAMSVFEVQLEPDVALLSEVVVTGTGVPTEKRKLAFAVESLSSKDIPQVPTASIDQALVGKIPGAQISSINGTPGSEMSILLRGINSINRSTMPIILLDGVQMGATLLSSIDPNSIERVEVIQGAAASTIYGAQGANGVIQLFTKKGERGRLSINFSTGFASNEFLNIGNLHKASQHGFTTNANNEVINPGNGVPLEQNPETLLYNGSVGYAPFNPLTKFDKPYDQNLKYIDHFKVFFKPANIYTARVGISGGSDISDFNISLSKTRHESNFKGDGYNDRSNLNLNYGIELAKTLKLRSITQLIYNLNTIDILEKQDFGFNRETFNFLNARPFIDFQIKDLEGNYGFFYGFAGGTNYRNPLYRYQYTSTIDKKLDVLQNFNLTWTINKNIDVDLLYGINYQQRIVRYEAQNQSLNKNSEAIKSAWIWAGVNNSIDNTGEITLFDIRRTFQNFKATSTLRYDLEEDFHINIPLRSYTQLAFDYRSDDQNKMQTYALGMPEIPPISASLGSSFNIPEDYKEKFVTYGYLVNQRFEYKDIAGVSGGFRSDYSSAFGRGSKPFNFPRGDAFIRLSALDFWDNIFISKAILEWKIRAAYGEAGIQPKPFDRYVTLSSKALGTSNALYFPPYQSNPSLGVEVSKELEVGTDMTFEGMNGNWLRNYQLSLSYWTRKTENSIMRVDAPPSSGMGMVLDNSVSLESKGIQVSFLSKLFKSQLLAWNLILNFSTQQSNVTKVKGDEIIAGNRIIKAGEEVGQFYGRLLLTSVTQKDPNGDPFIPETIQGNYEVASNGWVVDKTSRQPFITSERYSLGSPNPDFMMSFINDISIKNFLTISFQFDWIKGQKLYNNTRQWMYRDGIHSDYEKPFTINGETGAWTAFYRGIYDFSTGWDKNYFLEDASFLRLRNVSVGIDLPNLFRILKPNKVQLVLSGRNLWTKTKYSGMDPEISSWDAESVWYGSTTPLYRGVDDSSQPNFRSYQITLNVGI